MPEYGQCKLCLPDRPIELRQSHYLPAAIYRVLRDEAERNPNPVMLNERGVVRTSRQMMAPLLCANCEDRLNKGGERWTLANCIRRDGSFPLAELLASRSPDIASDTDTTTKMYFSSGIPEVDASAIRYFAASVFWRGAIHPWDGTIPVRLGPYQEKFRRYLMGLQSFPENSALWVVVREGKEASRLTYSPVGARQGDCHIFRFPMPGLAFVLLVGKQIPARPRDYCFVRGQGNPIIVTSNLERLLIDEAVAMRRMSLGIADNRLQKRH
ncbi:MAG: hypothetical protein JWR07_3713 [Nevskia sp.]|nr:hypothetical protein [Nevskia sp.]